MFFGALGLFLGVDLRLQLVDGLDERLGFFPVGDFATGEIGAGVNARNSCAEAIEVHADVVASVKHGQTFIQRRKGRAGISGVGIGGKKSGALQFWRQLFLDVAAAAFRIDRVLRVLVLLDALDGIELMSAAGALGRLLRRARSSGARRPLRSSAPGANGQRRRRAQHQN